MNKKDIKLLAKKTLYQGFFRADLLTLQFKLFEGGWSSIIEREVFIRPPAVGVLLFDPQLDKVVLIEQFRPGTLNHPKSPWSIEIVAGIIEPNEAPKDVAIRESKEEANCDVLKLIPICDYWPSAGGSDEQVILFCGLIDASSAGGIYGIQEESEDIKVHCISTAAALQLLRDNKICNSAAIIALQWLELNKQNLI